MNLPEWPSEVISKLIELKSAHPELSDKQLSDRLSETYGKRYTYNAVRKKLMRMRKKGTKAEIPDPGILPDFNGSSTEIHSDGTQSSNKLLRMSIEDSKDVNFLLQAHGFDREVWELISARHNIWNAYSTQDGIQTLYASKITVRPRKNEYTLQHLIEAIKDTKPIHIELAEIVTNEKRLLEIPIFDAHFGVSDYTYYKPTQTKIMILLTSRYWEEVLFIIGQDMLHNDDFRGRTANGTQIETVDMVKAWHDCRSFYEILIETSIKQARSVKAMYAKGNHDESMSWAFVQYLKARFPSIIVDDDLTERKAHTFGDNFIGITHGDKARKNLHNLFPIEFPAEWSKAKNREIHTGHYHVEDGKDVFGMMVRTLATRNKTDKWHKDNGFVGAHKRFMLFEYSEDELESIHYV